MHALLDRLIVNHRDPRQVRMAKSAAWLYWLGIAVVLTGIQLPAETQMNRDAILLLAAGGLASSLVLILIPWQIFALKTFYIMAALACSHIGTLVYYSGGVESPYAELYFLVAIWAAYFFSFRGFGVVGALVTASSMAPFIYDQAYDNSQITTGVTRVLFMLIAGGLVNLLVSQVRTRNIDLGHTNERLALKMREVLIEKEKTAAVLASVGDGVYVIDNNRRIVLWNHAAEEITGFGSDEMVGKECHQAMEPAEADRERVCTPLCDSLAEMDPHSSGIAYEVHTCRKDSERIWLSVSAAPIRDAGRVTGIVHVFRDISEYKEIDRMRSDFVATVSHELRTPLTSILGFSKTLLRSDAKFSEESRQSFLTEIVREGERLARLIEDVLSVSRIEAGKLQLDLKPITVGPAVSHVVKNVSKLTSLHNFVINVPDDIPPVLADGDKFHQVLLNLVVNAVKYSPEGGDIRVSAEHRDARVRFVVEDQGVGISAEHLPHIFERFYRAGPRGKKGATGTGLGLYVSRNLVEQMGGRIWVESDIGQGSRFYFELPLAQPEQGDQTAAEKRIAS